MGIGEGKGRGKGKGDGNGNNRGKGMDKGELFFLYYIFRISNTYFFIILSQKSVTTVKCNIKSIFYPLSLNPHKVFLFYYRIYSYFF